MLWCGWWDDVIMTIIQYLSLPNQLLKASRFVWFFQVFEIQVMFLKMGESLRPRRIVFYKSSTDVASLQPWIYRVQSEQNCTKLYGIPPGTANVVSVNSQLCQIYITGPQTLDEVVSKMFKIWSQSQVSCWRDLSKVKTRKRCLQRIEAEMICFLALFNSGDNSEY